MTIDSMIDAVLKREGGYVNHPLDKGGATNYGITLATLREWRKDNSLQAEDVALLTVPEARQIYKNLYFDAPGFGQLPEAIWPAIFDAAVNHGPAGAIKMLQKALGVAVDGKIGPETIAASKAHHPGALVALFLAERARKYGAIVTADPTQAVFAKGWLNRLAEFIEELGKA